jgi:hypothetical protein
MNEIENAVMQCVAKYEPNGCTIHQILEYTRAYTRFGDVQVTHVIHDMVNQFQLVIAEQSQDETFKRLILPVEY